MSSDEIKYGDIVFAHGTGFISWAIRVAEWVRFRRGDRYNHVAVIGWALPDGDWAIIQAATWGVSVDTLTSLKAKKGDTLRIVSPPECVDRLKLLNFMQQQVGDRYGFLTIASVTISIILPGSVSLYKPGTWICSAVAAEALRYAGWYHPWNNIYQVTPAQLYEALT